MFKKIILSIVVSSTLVNSCSNERDEELIKTLKPFKKDEKRENYRSVKNKKTEDDSLKIINYSSKEASEETINDGGDPKDIPPRR